MATDVAGWRLAGRGAARVLWCAGALLLAACGAGTTGSGTSAGGGSSGTSGAFAQKCAPDNTFARTSSGALLSGYGAGTLNDEKSWLRAYMTDKYLWYREMPTVNASLPLYSNGEYDTLMESYFEALKTPALTASGKRKDAFSFRQSTQEWQQLSQAGVVYGYGLDWRIASNTAPRGIRVAYVTPGTPAATAGVQRGDTLLSVTYGGATVSPDATDTAGIDRLNAALFPSAGGTAATFRLQAAGGAARDVTLQSAQITTSPVLVGTVLTTGATKVGYLVLNDFVLPAEGQLRTAFQNFQAQGVGDVVLDLRYNGGGYLYIASQIAYMVAGAARTTGRIFEKSLYNDKRTSETNAAASVVDFENTTSGIAGSGTTGNAALPALNLSRLFVLTTSATCSASESVVNGLRGIDFPVVVIGSATCGKPYGFTAKDNCGVSYFPVEFQGVNQKGEGDYADGLLPTCTVSDDLGHALGDPNEGQLAAALSYRTASQCPASAVSKDLDPVRGDLGRVFRTPARNNKYLR